MVTDSNWSKEEFLKRDFGDSSTKITEKNSKYSKITNSYTNSYNVFTHSVSGSPDSSGSDISSIEISSNSQQIIPKEIAGPINFDKRKEKLQNKQDDLQQQLDNLKTNKPSIMKPKKRKEYNKKKEDLKSQLREASKEKWQAILDQRFEESRNEPLDKVAEESGSKYIKKETKKHNYHNNYCYYKKSEDGTYKHLEFRTLGEIADRLSSSKDINYGDQDKYTDWRILLKIAINTIENSLKEENLTKEDKKALKEIYQDLKKEKDKSKKDFNPKNEGYIQESKGTRGFPQSTFQKALVQQGQRDMATSSV